MYRLRAILDSHFLRFPCQYANQRKGKNKFKNTLNLVFKEKQISIHVEQEGLPPSIQQASRLALRVPESTPDATLD